MKNNINELLAPAGDLEKAYVALDYGADAVFLGAKSYSLRARASNFDNKDIKEIIDYAHSKNKKVYLVTNVICHNPLLKQLPDFLKEITQYGADGYITADPYIVKYLRDNYSDCEIHISTQQSICNSKAALFWKRNKATRVVLARELTLSELTALMHNLKNAIEIEVFIHGAVCISYSGRCMMSNNFSLRDANVGGCAQSCRWEYEVENQEIKNKSKMFTMSAKDMAQLPNMQSLCKLGIASFKVEGRMKSLHYIATVISVYRKAIDRIENNQPLELNYLEQELKKAAARETDTAFMDGQPGYDKMLYHEIKNPLMQNFAFIVDKKINDYQYQITTKNHIELSDEFEIIGAHHDLIHAQFASMKTLDNHDLTVCPTPMTKLIVSFKKPILLEHNDIARISLKK